MKCYLCDAEGTTREHVPPQSFFPDGFRDNLTTVPSCPQHNHSQSLDIEYVRNILTMSMGINELGNDVFKVTKRSFDRSPKLFAKTTKDVERVYVKGQETGMFAVDLDRLRAVMQPIASAIYFKDYGVSYASKWKVFVTSLTTQQEFQTGVSGWEPFVDYIMGFQYKQKEVPHPEVFRYGVFEMVRGIAYEFVFYDGFFVHCWGAR